MATSKDGGRKRSRSPRDRRGDVLDKRIYISNIPFETKWMNLKDILKERVGDVAYVEMYETNSGKSKGCAVVEFKTKETANKAIDVMNNYEISGRKILVREAREADKKRLEREAVPQSASGKRKLEDREGVKGPRDGGLGPMNGSQLGGDHQWQALLSAVPTKILQSIGVDPTGSLSSTLFVSNLSFNAKWKHLYEVFSMAGKVVTGEMKLDDDGKSRGMAIVQMDNPLEAIQAISLFNNQPLFDRKMSVRMDKYDGNEPNKKTENKRNSGGLPEGLKFVGLGLGANGTIVNIGRLVAEQQRVNRMQQSMEMMSEMMSGGSMGMGMGGGMPGMGMAAGMGMSGGMDSGMGGRMGSGMGSAMGVSGLGMGGGNFPSDMMREGFGSSMAASVSNSMSDARNAGGLVSMANMRDVGGPPLSEQLRAMRNVGGGLVSGMGGMPGMGLSSMHDNFARSSMNNEMTDGRSFGGMGMGSGGGGGGGNTNGRNPECAVFVRNLPFSVTWQELKDKFRAVGDVRFAEIKMKDGKSQGCGLVRFSSSDEAMRAIDLFHGTRVDGREIEVRLDRG